jgi:hypothetical protein
VDFVRVDMRLTIPRDSDHNTRHCFRFSIIGDDRRELNETFFITFYPANSLDRISGGSVVTVVIIDDNDSKFCK